MVYFLLLLILKVFLLNILVETVMPFFQDSKQNRNIIDFTFDQFNAFWLNKINFFKKSTDNKLLNISLYVKYIYGVGKL